MFDISLIVPVYNKGDALIPCLDSIKKQSFQRFECILVDDGSTDGCARICDRYARDDPRFKVIHKTNGGVSSSRNAGIHAASGTYLMFCDADDTIPKDALESLIDFVESTSLKVCLNS